MDQVGVAGVMVVGIPVGPLAKAPEVRGQHHVAAPSQLGGVVAALGGLGVEAADPGFSRAVPVDGQHRRAGRPPVVGDEQVGGDRHVRLGVEDDPPPPVAVAARLVGGLRVGRHRLGPRGQGAVESVLEPPRRHDPNAAGSSGSPSDSSTAISRLTAWYQGEKLRRGVGSWITDRTSSRLGSRHRPRRPARGAVPRRSRRRAASYVATTLRETGPGARGSPDPRPARPG